ncbi:BLUF domain-containing protein [Curtobacterium sp. MCPF17_002]|uniref:BLUF domain-containing protein n=1 Tax=Curtobacterium sp. MCPF17_002 TaxID=2175645 RepID=UPI0011B3F4EB|nr:BLUF domain-containing protein [Curtobacterium sp. MCPF17_002]WIB76987.1 BLUF domain-containing protein [Curtobacterium sp. MCPF17_002]
MQASAARILFSGGKTSSGRGNMLSIVYVSTARAELADADLQAILDVSRDLNVENSITGLLAYRRGRFMQLFEGPDAAVDGTFARIRMDSRHHSLELLSRAQRDARWFPEWSMAYEPITDESARDLPGFSDSLRSGEADSSRTQALLHWFRHHTLSAGSQ